jgi:endogenous inhibitor of DNA gyrase (YacG/DUF329 family)
MPNLRTCPQCGKEFLPYSSLSLYCSLRCKRAATTTRRKQRERIAVIPPKSQPPLSQEKVTEIHTKAGISPPQSQSKPESKPENTTSNPGAEDITEALNILAAGRKRRNEQS